MSHPMLKCGMSIPVPSLGASLSLDQLQLTPECLHCSEEIFISHKTAGETLKFLWQAGVDYNVNLAMPLKNF